MYYLPKATSHVTQTAVQVSRDKLAGLFFSGLFGANHEQLCPVSDRTIAPLLNYVYVAKRRIESRHNVRRALQQGIRKAHTTM